MSDKLKAKFASLLFPKSTVMTEKSEADMSAKNEQDQPGQDTNSASVDAGTSTGTATGITTGFTSTGTDNEASDHHIAVVFSDRDERARKQQTLESERARDELLAHGIKVRDFQAEADAKKYGEQK